MSTAAQEARRRMSSLDLAEGIDAHRKYSFKETVGVKVRTWVEGQVWSMRKCRLLSEADDYEEGRIDYK